MNLSVIILAAGKGTRMNSLKPKVFHEVANYPMLYHVIDSAMALSPYSCSLVVSKQMSDQAKLIKDKYNKVKFYIQKKQLGTANAVMSVTKTRLKSINDVTLILFGDSPLIETKTIRKMISKIKKNNADMLILTMKPDDPKNYGRIIVEKNRVKKIVEFSEASLSHKKIKLCNSGVMAFKTSILNKNLSKVKDNNSKKEFYLTDLVEILNQNKHTVLTHECNANETLGVNDRTDLQKVDSLFQLKIRDKLLKKGVTLLDPTSTYFSYDVDIGKDSTIFPNVYFGLNVKIGKNVKIKSFSNLEDADIRDGCEIGPFARIRNKTKILENSRVGNFVELKNSKISKEVKMAHLSYIGDATIEDNTNIGAGTITCNYDGKRKNKTKIGKNCFIGSNTSLIAPLEIKKNSIVGAGTVLKNNVSVGTTVFRKSELIKKKNFKKER